jgi:hypothetical protein
LISDNGHTKAESREETKGRVNLAYAVSKKGLPKMISDTILRDFVPYDIVNTLRFVEIELHKAESLNGVSADLACRSEDALRAFQCEVEDCPYGPGSNIPSNSHVSMMREKTHEVLARIEKEISRLQSCQ